ncbi:patatin-like phospholipase family protein [Parachitinimonas caeni]|uniref:Patatin-like phospholipase family protein n=1 Tax=Parachitinimonas caeni TaxID=3031301 RepID=A0ABT7E125_9NEIS|nr:patatin-like phospholipase family protein [Parachitinimonas caeni]MDK2126019.1 patatin-like phospholipase family protein [Parachitinimonas caeni]
MRINPLLLTTLAAVLLSGCAAVNVGNLPRNRPAVDPATQGPNLLREPSGGVGETAIGLSFSGGGIRAAAFAHGALKGLNQLNTQGGKTLLDDVALITSVSGGSMTAAYYGLHGKASLDTFREAGLLSDGEADLRLSLVNPVNIARMISGGMNDRANFQRWLEHDLYRNATFADIFRRGRPNIWINATDIYHRIAFPFHQRAFDVLCSDLASYPVSEAVAASMAVPLFFAPIVLEKHPEKCRGPLPDWDTQAENAKTQPLLMHALAHAAREYRDARAGRYIKLVDGGVADNYGLASIQQTRLLQGTPYGPLTEGDALRLRNMLFVVVDAGQGPSGEWNNSLAGPSGIDLASASIDAAMATNVRMSYDSFVQMVKTWQEDIIAYRCQLPAAKQAEVKATQPLWRCNDVSIVVTRISFESLGPAAATRLGAIPTRLKLPVNDIDDLIKAGEEAIGRNTVIKAFQSKVSGPTP